jgi:2-polyprenyl-3-methyl-5-hydroxy-6-metoxy-1,4-benzoquinol methylase
MDQDVENSLRVLPDGIETAIDLGCGLGKLGRIAKKVFPKIKIIGVDGNPDIIEALRQSESDPYEEIKLALIQDYLEVLPKSDIIMMGDVLEHLLKDELIKVIKVVRSKCQFALIVGPEQTKDELKRSIKLRNQLPILEHHLSLIRGEEIATMFGSTRWFSRKHTKNAQGENPYFKFCLLTKCKSSSKVPLV